MRAACEFLGFNLLYIANEDKLVTICAPEAADILLQAMQAHPLGSEAAIIGEMIENPHHFMQMETNFGGQGIIDWLSEEQLLRIC
ncbi:AIR synthase-related protein [Nitrosomonas sp. Nm33]|uniref:AIR synthase-related protein n=1 Tax=Nitrosomonas sp. Nm33 TaxID=133724 RepID=UPI000896BEE2|nr:AIR synthase-related protein [Nitrosomonas sp. Nm33]SDY74430.1 hydrogenase expression/formation protein HypE [Nitrosomonas sp. Nm33]